MVSAGVGREMERMLWSLYMSFKIVANKKMPIHSVYQPFCWRWRGVGAKVSCDSRVKHPESRAQAEVDAGKRI